MTMLEGANAGRQATLAVMGVGVPDGGDAGDERGRGAV